MAFIYFYICIYILLIYLRDILSFAWLTGYATRPVVLLILCIQIVLLRIIIDVVETILRVVSNPFLSILHVAAWNGTKKITMPALYCVGQSPIRHSDTYKTHPEDIHDLDPRAEEKGHVLFNFHLISLLAGNWLQFGYNRQQPFMPATLKGRKQSNTPRHTEDSCHPGRSANSLNNPRE